jgi:hypothetical protein
LFVTYEISCSDCILQVAKHVVECLDRAFIIYNDESRAYPAARLPAGEALYFDRALNREQPDFDATLTRKGSTVSEAVDEIEGERFSCQLYDPEHIGEKHPVLVIVNHKGFCILSATLPFAVFGWHQVRLLCKNHFYDVSLADFLKGV